MTDLKKAAWLLDTICGAVNDLDEVAFLSFIGTMVDNYSAANDKRPEDLLQTLTEVSAMVNATVGRMEV